MQVWFRRALVMTSLSLLAWFMVISQQTLLMVKVYGVISGSTCLAYAIDKASAKDHRWRIPESTLHVFGLLGGWPGALLAQTFLRHKSVKRQFQWVFWITVVINLLLLAWLFSRGQ